MNEKKQVATIWLLTALIVILIIVIIGLFITVVKMKKQANIEAEQQLAQQQQQTVDYELSKSFDGRTKMYFEQLKENSGDRTKQEYANVRLSKVNEKNYELKADIRGELRFNKEDIINWIKEIEDNKLDKLEIPLQNEDKEIIIYSQKPEFANNNLAYYDDDWEEAKDGEWLDENGIPMFMELRRLNYENYDSPIFIRKEDDGYYYAKYRSMAGVVNNYHKVMIINEKDAIRISLLPDDKISLDYYNPLGPEKKEPVEITVEEYYNSSPTTINEELKIDANDMSPEFGFEIIDGAIHVIAHYEGP